MPIPLYQIKGLAKAAGFCYSVLKVQIATYLYTHIYTYDIYIKLYITYSMPKDTGKIIEQIHNYIRLKSKHSDFQLLSHEKLFLALKFFLQSTVQYSRVTIKQHV